MGIFMNLLAKPKHIIIRTKTASGQMRETHFEDIIYLDLLDMSKQETDKCIFLINLNK